MKKTYRTSGICAQAIEYELSGDGIVSNVRFLGGCNGNGQGVAALVEGQHRDEVIKRLRGIPCRMGTSCPDQLAKALAEETGN